MPCQTRRSLYIRLSCITVDITDLGYNKLRKLKGNCRLIKYHDTRITKSLNMKKTWLNDERTFHFISSNHPNHCCLNRFSGRCFQFSSIYYSLELLRNWLFNKLVSNRNHDIHFTGLGRNNFSTDRFSIEKHLASIRFLY